MTPILGAWIADEFLGRLKTIQLSIGFALLGHVILIIAALPPVIVHPSGALGCFSVGLVIFGCGAGGFKYIFLPNRSFGGTKLTKSGQTSPRSSPNNTKRPKRTSKPYPKPANESSSTQPRPSPASSSTSIA